jgi:hypothetical protein
MTAARGGTAVTHEERRLEASRQRTVQPHAVVLLGGDAASARGPWGCASGCPDHVRWAARRPGGARRLTAFARVMVCPRGEARR